MEIPVNVRAILVDFKAPRCFLGGLLAAFASGTILEIGMLSRLKSAEITCRIPSSRHFVLIRGTNAAVSRPRKVRINQFFVDVDCAAMRKRRRVRATE
jgi:hypothetical protein